MTFETVLKGLHCLRPDGPEGFEGLIARLLERLTGQRFLLARSGRQDGKDLAGDARTGNRLAVECKRYLDCTPLPPDQLLAKLADAATGTVPPDLWIAVTTSRLATQHHETLDRAAQKLGVSWFAIDADAAGDDPSLSPLALLLATAPEIVGDHLRRFGQGLSDGDVTRSETWLVGQSNRGEVMTALAELRDRLLAENIGYDHWRQAQNTRFLSVIADALQAKAVFAQDLAVNDPGARLVPRAAVSAALDRWWDAWPENPRHAAILGEEGDGKTWGVAAWLAKRVSDARFPPVLFAPSGDMAGREPVDIAVGAIRRALGATGHEDWGQRLQRWLRPGVPAGPRLLLVLDGLNERPSGPWDALLTALSASPWAGAVAVALTSRTVFWRERLAGRLPAYEEIEVRPYDEQELHQALSLRGLTLGEIDDRLLPLLRRPRYLDMMARLHSEMADAGDVTIERLIYEDQRDKWSRRQSVAAELMSHEDFQEFLCRLAERPRAGQPLARPALMDELRGFGDDKALFTELETGRVLERLGTSRWSVNRRYLVLGLGLLLADVAREAAQTGTEGALEEAIRQFMEPQPDMDIKVEICGFALLHAFHHADDRFTMPVRLALFRAWIEGRNIAEADWLRLPAYLPLSPETYLEMAEVLWSLPTNNAEAQDAFMAGFLRYASSPRVHAVLVRHFERWFGFVHPDGHGGRYGSTDSARIEEGRRQVRTALGGEASEGSRELFGYWLTVTPDAGLLRLAQVALAVISHLDRTPFLRGIVTGILADQVMGQPSQPELLYWTLRTALDPIEAPLLGAARDLIAQGGEAAHKTADMLLAALATPAAANAREEVAEPYRYRHPLRELWEQDPCRFNMLWDAETGTRCLAREDVALGSKLRLSSSVALDPRTEFPSSFARALAETELDFDLSHVAARINGQTAEDLGIRDIEPALCAVAPRRMAELERALVGCLPDRRGAARRLLAFRVFAHLIVMGPKEREIILDCWRAVLLEPDGSNEDHFAESVLFQCACWGADADAHLSLILQRRSKSNFSPGYAAPAVTIGPDLADRIADALRSEDDDDVRYSLLAWLDEGLVEMTDHLRNTLLWLCRNDGARFAFACRRVLIRLGDEIGAQAIISGGDDFLSGDPCEHDPSTSLLVCKFGDALPFDLVVERVAPQFLGLAVESRGLVPSEVARFGETLDAELERSTQIVGELPPAAASAIVEVDWCGLDELECRWDLGRERQQKLVFMSMGGIWGGNPGRDSDSAWPPSFPSAEELTHQSNVLRRTVGEFIDDRLGRGCRLIATGFESAALGAVVEANPALVTDWLTRVLPQTPAANSLIAACRGFFEALCEVLLGAWPEQGVALFHRLQACPPFRLVDRATEIDNLLFVLFRAPSSTPVDSLKADLFEQCVTDADLFDLAFVAQLACADDWLEGQIGRWLASERRFDRARGIVLLGLLNAEDAEARLVQAKAAHGQCWLGSRAEAAAQIARRNRWAQHWFERFLRAPDDLDGWAAFRIFLQCVDRRFWLWGPALVQAQCLFDSRNLHYQANRRAIAAAARRNERGTLKLHERLVGEKVLEGKAWPWMGRFLADRQS
jgi:hypothetical protein